uniref:Uncharacterized protein n=1 Tax=Solanum lycopersicum TaxID=4081 RepID=A0A3Q7G5I2_SOLLC
MLPCYNTIFVIKTSLNKINSTLKLLKQGNETKKRWSFIVFSNQWNSFFF